MFSSARFSFWWLHPVWIFGLVSGVTLVLAFWQDEVAFELYGMLKYVNQEHLLIGALSILAFGGGSYIGRCTADMSPPRDVNRKVLRNWFYGALSLTLFGYLVWFAVGVKNGASPGLFLELLKADDVILVESMREEYFPTIPGVTTCTQFGMAAILLGLVQYFQGDRKALLWITALLLIALIRVILLSERMALIELVVPSVILAVRLGVITRRDSWRVRSMGSALPIIAPLMLAVTFGAFEYFRSWQYYTNDFNSYPEFVVWRLSGYYTTSHNNGAMAVETGDSRPLPYFSVEAFWKFPGVSESPIGYEKLTSINVLDTYDQMLLNFGNPELNNEGGLFQPLLDWGLPLSLVFWAGYGFIAGRSYTYYLVGHLGGVLFYPIVFVTLIDVPRLLMISDPRLTPTLAIIAMAVVTSKSEAIEPT